MITAIRQVLMVAHFESKMLLRSWAFRFIAFLCFAASMAQASVHLALIYFVSAEAYLGPVFTSSNMAMMVITSMGGGVDPYGCFSCERHWLAR